MRKIAIINVYYGSFPPYMSLWLKSCEYNPAIDFFLVTDNILGDFPGNVHLINLSFNDFKSLTERKLATKVSLDKPYKICDLKPMYGAIFEDYLGEYDYWGHCDLDLIFGNLNYFFEEYHLENYTKFGYLGHLSLYKNNEIGKFLFKLPGSKCGNWIDVVSSPKNFLFDEWNGMLAICRQNNIELFEERIFADIATIYKRFRLALDDVNYDQQVFYWEKGHVYRTYWDTGKQKKDEFLYIHFKKRNFTKESFDSNKVDSFFIGPDGFMEKQPSVSLDDVNRINPYPGSEYEKQELLKYKQKVLFMRLRKLLKKIF